MKGGDSVKKEFITADAKFVYSKNELGYQEVLDNFEMASEITIITYNISEKKNALVSALKKAGEHCVVNIITNIPSRWETYYGDTFRDKARQKINLYLLKLKPESVPSQQKWTQKSFKKRNESQYFVNLRKPTAFIPRFA